MEQVYQTLISRALQICQSHQNEDAYTSKRVIIALSGPPGSGKSTIAATVVQRLNSLCTKPFAITIPMDGFHYPKKYLDALPNHEEYARRGSHWAFDAKGVLHLIKALHHSKTTLREIIHAPQFDNSVADPVEGVICVSPEISLIILEGNHMAYNVDPWSEVDKYVDDVWSVDVDPETARQRIARRHIESGIERAWEDAIRRAENNDLPNAFDIRTPLVRSVLVVRSVNE